MTHILPRPTGGRRADDAIAERDQRIDQLETDNVALIADNEDLVGRLVEGTVRGCQDATRIAALEAELVAAVAELKRRADRIYRAEAEHRRLRQAVLDARPRVRVVETDLVRPYAPVVVLPYISPAPVAVERSGEDDDPGWETE